jgi:hypothetical protein
MHEKWNNTMGLTIIGSKEDDESWRLVFLYLLMMLLEEYLLDLIGMKDFRLHSDFGENILLVLYLEIFLLILVSENLNPFILIDLLPTRSIIPMPQMIVNSLHSLVEYARVSVLILSLRTLLKEKEESNV